MEVPVKITREKLELDVFSVNALCFIPREIKHNFWCLLSHGYTSHKASILNWAIRLSELGLPVCLHDQPGHYLGSFNEVKSFEDFVDNVHKLYIKSFDLLNSKIGSKPDHLIFAGHSMGGLTSLKAMELPQFNQYKKTGIGVGLGLPNDNKTHFFETEFYKATLMIRDQLVAPCITSDKIFSWLRDQKKQLTVKDSRIHLISGEDDVIVGSDGIEILKDVLDKNGNNVSFYKPKKLAHHLPENAAPHIMSFLRSEFSW